MQPILSRFTATTCLGHGLKPMAKALRDGRGGLAPCRFETVDLDIHVGEVSGVDEEQLPASLRGFDCRNNRLAQLALRQDGFEEFLRSTISRLGARRFGLFLGTSTSGILETEIAYRHRHPVSGALPPALNYRGSHSTFSVAEFLRGLLGIEGPTAVVSTACSSSAKAFASAQRMIEADLIDGALVGGVDSLCLTTLYGFHSLQLTARGPCRPFAADRDGISIGEGAAFAVLERIGTGADSRSVAFLGSGESSDAYHLSSPHPQGLGARQAMQSALRRADLEPGQIDYVNLHGTATPSNDRAEGRALIEVFGTDVPCSSTKGATGHVLGAAGAVEAVVCAIALTDGFLPAGINTVAVDPALKVRYLTSALCVQPLRVLSNSFGFGGTNCSLVFGRLA
jgi:3-oxoacyl-[acyl-carrier-protein] synthase-1